MDLKNQKCVPCEGGVPPMKVDQVTEQLKNIDKWEDVLHRAITKGFEFTNFKEALAFVNQVGEIAEANGHHPDIKLYDYKMVQITLATHAIGGLSMNDFILAAKIDDLNLG